MAVIFVSGRWGVPTDNLEYHNCPVIRLQRPEISSLEWRRWRRHVGRSGYSLSRNAPLAIPLAPGFVAARTFACRRWRARWGHSRIGKSCLDARCNGRFKLLSAHRHSTRLRLLLQDRWRSSCGCSRPSLLLNSLLPRCSNPRQRFLICSSPFLTLF